MAAIREGVRAYAADPSHSFDTVLGAESFDANGDTNLPFISFYTVDPAAKDGIGDWVFKEQIDFGDEVDRRSSEAGGRVPPGFPIQGGEVAELP